MSSSFKAVLAGALFLGLAGPCSATLDEVAQSLAEGNHSRAIAQLQAVPAIERDSYRGRLLYAGVLLAQGQREEAADLYRELIDTLPGQPEAYNNLAVLYAAEGRTDEALELLEQAMNTSATYATVRANLGQIYLDMSLNSYAKALRVDERDTPPSLKTLYQLNSPNPSAPGTLVLAQTQTQTQAGTATASLSAGEPQAELTASPATMSSRQESAVSSQPSEPARVADADFELPPQMETAKPVISTPVIESAEVAGSSPGEESAEVAVTPPVAEPAEVAVTPGEAEPAGMVVTTPEVFSDETPASAPDSAIAAATEVVGAVVAEAGPVGESAALNLVSEAAAGSTVTAGPEQAVQKAVQAWATAWAGQDVETYLAAYSEGFVPPLGMSREQWQAQRRQRLSKPELIEVELEAISVRLSSNTLAQVNFLQRYRSDRYRDKTRKRLQLVNEGGDWKILAEKTLEVIQ